MDDLGVPLVSETSLFSVMLEILDSLLHSWIIQLKLNSLWNTCCLMIRKCTTLLLRPQIYYIAVSRPGGGLKSSWKWRLYLRSDKVRRSTSSTILVSVSIFKVPRLIDAWSFCCFEWSKRCPEDVCGHCWPGTSYEKSRCEPWHA